MEHVRYLDLNKWELCVSIAGMLLCMYDVFNEIIIPHASLDFDDWYLSQSSLIFLAKKKKQVDLIRTEGRA